MVETDKGEPFVEGDPQAAKPRYSRLGATIVLWRQSDTMSEYQAPGCEMVKGGGMTMLFSHPKGNPRTVHACPHLAAPSKVKDSVPRVPFP